ncbi:hypothetical protein LCGC14_2859960, partial [marine sediment metagenome]
NQGDAFAYQTEKLLAEQGEKVSAEDRSNIESGISQLHEALKADDAQAIQRAMSNLQQASHKLAEQMYQATGAQAPGQADPAEPAPEGPPSDKGGEDVIDAEFDVKE